MMKSAEDRPYSDVAQLLNGTKKRCIPGKSKMCPDMVVVGGIGLEGSPQMVLAKDDHVIKALPADRANQPLLPTNNFIQTVNELRVG